MWVFLSVCAVCVACLAHAVIVNRTPVAAARAQAEAYAEAYSDYCYAMRNWVEGDPVPVPPVFPQEPPQ